MRRVLILLLWCGDVCLYMARTNVSVAISQMFGKTTQEGELLSAFYWGYFLFQLPAGWLAPRVGAHRLLSAAVTVWSIASAASCFTGGSITALFALRVVVGCAESCCYPCMSQLLSVWVPYDERGTAWGVVQTGESAGTILMLTGGPFLIASPAGWRSVFWLSAGLGLGWVLVFVFFASADPAQHRCISDEERSYIQASRPPRPPYTKTPWRAILTNRPFLCTIACHVMYNWTFYIGLPPHARPSKHPAQLLDLRLPVRAAASSFSPPSPDAPPLLAVSSGLSWIDKFLESSWRATASAGTLAAASVVPYCCLFVLSALSGVVADNLESRFGFSPTHARKLVNSVGLLGGAAGFVALSLVAPTGGGGPRGSLMAATACLSVAIGMAGFGAAAGYWATFGDLSPRHGALLLALSNALASVPGIVGNTVVGNLLASTHNDWALVFQICAGTLVLGALVFLGAEARDQHLDERRGAGLAAKLLVADAAAAGEGEGLGAAGSVQAADASSSAGA